MKLRPGQRAAIDRIVREGLGDEAPDRAQLEAELDAAARVADVVARTRRPGGSVRTHRTRVDVERAPAQVEQAPSIDNLESGADPARNYSREELADVVARTRKGHRGRARTHRGQGQASASPANPSEILGGLE